MEPHSSSPHLAWIADQDPPEKWYRHFTAEEKQESAANLQFKGKLDDPASWLEPAGGKLAFRAVSQDKAVEFVPLSGIVHERYSVYHEIKESNS